MPYNAAYGARRVRNLSPNRSARTPSRPENHEAREAFRRIDYGVAWFVRSDAEVTSGVECCESCAKRAVCRVVGHRRRALDLNYGDAYICTRCGGRIYV